VLLLLPVLLPYAFIPLRVYRQRLRSGLILAMVMGCAVFVPGICLIWFAFRWDRGWWLLCSLILMTILQPVLVVTALACFESWESSLISLPMSHQQPFRLKLLGVRPKIDFLRTDSYARSLSMLAYPVQWASSNDGSAPMIGILGSIPFPFSTFLSSSSLYS